MDQKNFLTIVSSSFAAGEVLSINDIQEKTKITKANIGYYLGLLDKVGAVRKVSRGKWVVKTEEGLLNPAIPNDNFEFLLRISPKEKEVLGLIFEVPLKMVRNTTRFNLGSLKEKLTKPDQHAVLDGLLSKLQQQRIIKIIGAGNNGETIIQINDDLLLKCLSDEYCKTIPVSDNELDSKIAKIIFDSSQSAKEKEGLEALLETKELEVGKIKQEIALLEKNKEEIIDTIKEAKIKIERIEQDSFEIDFIKFLETMPAEKRRSFFKKILED